MDPITITAIATVAIAVATAGTWWAAHTNGKESLPLLQSQADSLASLATPMLQLDAGRALPDGRNFFEGDPPTHLAPRLVNVGQIPLRIRRIELRLFIAERELPRSSVLNGDPSIQLQALRPREDYDLIFDVAPELLARIRAPRSPNEPAFHLEVDADYAPLFSDRWIRYSTRADWFFDRRFPTKGIARPIGEDFREAPPALRDPRPAWQPRWLEEERR